MSIYAHEGPVLRVLDEPTNGPDQFAAELDKLLENPAEQYVVDYAPHVEHVKSTHIGILIFASVRAARAGSWFLVRCSPQLARLFRVIGGEYLKMEEYDDSTSEAGNVIA